ncbi:MAG: DMT family transporter [Acidimicrobiia bacterium]
MNRWTPLVAATFGWAASAVLSRAAILRGVDTFTLVPLRMIFAMATLGIVIAVTGRFGRPSAEAWKRGLWLGTVAMAIPMTVMTLALQDLPVTLGGMLIALIPLATVVAAHFIVSGERFQSRSLPGFLIALIGTAVLVGFGGESAEGVDNLWRGVGFMAVGVTMAGIGGALSRRFALEVPSDQLVLPQFTVNTVVLLVLTPLLFEIDVASVDTTSWWLIAGVGALGTTLAFASFLVGAATNPASRLALTGYAVPVVSVALAVIFLDETLTVSIVIGAIVILTGVILADRATDHVPEPGVPIPR